MSKQYFSFEQVGIEEQKMWHVCSVKNGNILGFIDRDDERNRFVFTPEDNADINWTSEYLQQIVDFLKELEK